MWDKVKGLIGGVAPMVASLIGGPVTGQIVGKVAGLLGCNNDPASIEEALNNQPELLVELKKYEMDHEVDLQKLKLEDRQINLERLEKELKDVGNARNAEVEKTKATGKRDWIIPALAALFVSGFFLLIGYIIKQGIKESAMLMMCVGALISNVNQVMTYYFGSSKSSSEKNRIIEKMKSAKK